MLFDFARLLPPHPSVNPLLQGGTTPPDSLKWLEAQFEIATTALLGGLTILVVLAAGTSGFDVAYDSSIANVGRHDLQHGIDTAANWTGIAAVTRQHVALVAKLARALAATPELNASGWMLDHTAIVFVSNLFNTLGHAAGDSDFNTFGSEGPTKFVQGFVLSS